ncbi:MAG: ABC transporter permease [Cyclobacteriaceae bacterium]|nr:ABC transporter permease [Cyclobacteriaceae bacterium]
MNLAENFREGLRSVNANLLRSILTATIVAFGIMSLVGILTAIDGIQNSVNDSLSELGVNTFNISSKENRSQRRSGVVEKSYPQLKYKEIKEFEENYFYPSTMLISATVTQIAEVKRLSKKTNPNVWVAGGNDEYVTLNGLYIDKGRNFSNLDLQYGTNVIIIGHQILKDLYDENEEAIGTNLNFLGGKYRVIGVLEKKGMSNRNYDNSIVMPLLTAKRAGGNRQLSYTITIGISDQTKIDQAMGEATGIMRKIRRDRLGDPNSFDIEQSMSLSERMAEVTGVLRVGGFTVGFVTLLGASIALMNIMMVSVTERTREVGVRKAIGATPLRIRQQFIVEAIVVCLIGGFFGIILGILIGNLVASLMGITNVVIPWIWMLFGVVICVLVGLISGYYPAYKASKLHPIDSLRFE